MSAIINTAPKPERRAVPWNKGKLLGQKPPLKLKEIWAIRFDCSWIIEPENLHYSTLPSTASCAGATSSDFASMMWSRAVMSQLARLSCRRRRSGRCSLNSLSKRAMRLRDGFNTAHLKPEQFLFPSRLSESPHLSTGQYSRIVGSWVRSIGLDPAAYGTHSMRRTKPTLIYRRTKNLRAVQLLLGHSKLESTVRYLGIEVDDALEMAEQTEV